eukprot:7280220-Heterocapsa_arctica.AAC.1
MEIAEYNNEEHIEQVTPDPIHVASQAAIAKYTSRCEQGIEQQSKALTVIKYTFGHVMTFTERKATRPVTLRNLKLIEMTYWLPILCSKDEVSYHVIKGKENLRAPVPSKFMVATPPTP